MLIRTLWSASKRSFLQVGSVETWTIRLFNSCFACMSFDWRTSCKTKRSSNFAGPSPASLPPFQGHARISNQSQSELLSLGVDWRVWKSSDPRKASPFGNYNFGYWSVCTCISSPFTQHNDHELAWDTGHNWISFGHIDTWLIANTKVTLHQKYSPPEHACCRFEFITLCSEQTKRSYL